MIRRRRVDDDVRLGHGLRDRIGIVERGLQDLAAEMAQLLGVSVAASRRRNVVASLGEQELEDATADETRANEKQLGLARRVLMRSEVRRERKRSDVPSWACPRVSSGLAQSALEHRASSQHTERRDDVARLRSWRHRARAAAGAQKA